MGASPGERMAIGTFPHAARVLIAGTIDLDLAEAIVLQIVDRSVRQDAEAPLVIAALADRETNDRLDERLGGSVRVVPINAGLDGDDWVGRIAALSGDAGLDAVVCRFEHIDRRWLDEIAPEDWVTGLRANARTSWRLAQASVPLLAKRGGSFVALTSRAVHEAVPGSGAFGCAKVFEAMLLRNAGVEALPRGVRVNLLRTSPPAMMGHELVGTRESVDDIVHALGFLLSPAAHGINAAIIPVDARTAVAGTTQAQFGIPARPAGPAATPIDARRLRAIVTGGAGRIGVESVRALHAQAILDGRDGLSVVLADRNAAHLADVAPQLAAMGIEVAEIVCDLGDPAVPARLVDKAVGRFGGLDVIVSNAALGVTDTALDAPVETFERIASINLDATWRFAHAAASHLAAAGGCLIATSSIASLNANGRAPLYAASKAALTMFVTQLALEWARKGIRANVVCPGSIDTPMNQLSALPAADRDRIVATFPTPRMGTAAEVAAGVAFFASRAASYVTGQNLVIDGGLANALR